MAILLDMRSSLSNADSPAKKGEPSVAASLTNVLIIGATSAIAERMARLWAARRARLFLAARNQEKLAPIALDLTVRGADVRTEAFEALDTECIAPLIGNAQAWLGSIDVVLIAYGSLPDQEACNADLALTSQAIRVNALSVLMLVTEVARRLEAQGHGSIVVLSSVAGDRGRQSNYIYGAAKAMINIALQGLRNRLAGKGVHVLTVKLGRVDTPMTARFSPKGVFWAKPESVAAGIVCAIDRRQDVVYLPWFWEPIMVAMRALPERIFKRMSL